MSHTPRLRTSRQELQTSPMETQAGTCSTAVPGEQSTVPRGTHSCIPSFHCPRKRARARTRIPANAASADGGSSTGGSPGFAILPGVLQHPGSRAHCKPSYPCASLRCREEHSPRSERLCRATKLPDTDPECTQKQWQSGPKMSTWI